MDVTELCAQAYMTACWREADLAWVHNSLWAGIQSWQAYKAGVAQSV